MKKNCFYFMTSFFPHGKLRGLLLPLKLTVILIILTTFNALALGLGDAQQQKVTGKVIDANTNEPLIGVNVAVEGTTVGTITDVGGNYSLVPPGASATLVFTYIGYVTQKVQFQGQTTIDIKMTSEVLNLEEVVVIGYGTARKSDISGSVVSVSREEMLKKAPTNILQGLKGLAAGVIVTAQDGAPDANSAIRIRGVATINGSANPLYVVDGVQVGTNANFLNPNDVESIEVLKDASATAIYGAAGANGNCRGL